MIRPRAVTGAERNAVFGPHFNQQSAARGGNSTKYPVERSRRRWWSLSQDSVRPGDNKVTQAPPPSMESGTVSRGHNSRQLPLFLAP